jgi:hypothetical protein
MESAFTGMELFTDISSLGSQRVERERKTPCISSQCDRAKNDLLPRRSEQYKALGTHHAMPAALALLVEHLLHRRGDILPRPASVSQYVSIDGLSASAIIHQAKTALCPLLSELSSPTQHPMVIGTDGLAAMGSSITLLVPPPQGIVGGPHTFSIIFSVKQVLIFLMAFSCRATGTSARRISTCRDGQASVGILS